MDTFIDMYLILFDELFTIIMIFFEIIHVGNWLEMKGCGGYLGLGLTTWDFGLGLV